MADFGYVDSIKSSKYELVFEANNLPPLGLHYFYIEKQKRIVKKIAKPDYKRTRFGNVVSILAWLTGQKYNPKPVHENVIYYLYL